MSGELILSREFNGSVIPQRVTDGYFDATAMCKAVGKKWYDYSRLEATTAFLETFSDEKAGNPAFSPIEVRAGRNGGTWVHPDVAINLAQWLSPQFARQVSKWVREILTTGRAELAPSSTGDAFLDMVEMTRRASEQTTQAFAAIAETWRRQKELERQQALTHQLATDAQETATQATQLATTALRVSQGNGGYYAVLGYCRVTGREITNAEAKEHGRRLSAMCRQRHIQTGQVHDEHWGTVNTYPESILQEYFDDDSTALNIIRH